MPIINSFCGAFAKRKKYMSRPRTPTPYLEEREVPPPRYLEVEEVEEVAEDSRLATRGQRTQDSDAVQGTGILTRQEMRVLLTRLRAGTEQTTVEGQQ